ncbi:Uncharacterized protein FWK35_00016047 [Aphis craccivora]|uniref:Uncharacterized protein n=1 Tax=Aphis craccivora TaxID=307492 RepID=A0A6G0YC06_APHCR|nr:Uncharacterized protein FWK35_00016047 [Aphis craccivora]
MICILRIMETEKSSKTYIQYVCDVLKLNPFSKNDLEFLEKYIVVIKPLCICHDVLQVCLNIFLSLKSKSIKKNTEFYYTSSDTFKSSLVPLLANCSQIFNINVNLTGNKWRNIVMLKKMCTYEDSRKQILPVTDPYPSTPICFKLTKTSVVEFTSRRYIPVDISLKY